MKYHRIKIKQGLNLTEIRESDLESLTFFINDLTVYENTLMIPHPYTLDNAREFLILVRNFENENQKQKDWSIRFRKKMIGGIGLLYNHGLNSHKSEIGYWIGEEFRNKGIMSEVLKTFSDFCLAKLSLQRLEAQVFEENLASQKVLVKAGFQEEGFLRKSYLKDGSFKNSFLFAKIVV